MADLIPSSPAPLTTYAAAPFDVVVILEGLPHVRLTVRIPQVMPKETLTDAVRRGVAQYLARVYPASTFRPTTFDIVPKAR